MIKTLFICDKCGKEVESKHLPEKWAYGPYELGKGCEHHCGRCKTRKKVTYKPYENTDPGVGALYGRT